RRTPAPSTAAAESSHERSIPRTTTGGQACGRRCAAGRREGAPLRLPVLGARTPWSRRVPPQLRARAAPAEVAEAAPLPALHAVRWPRTDTGGRRGSGGAGAATPQPPRARAAAGGRLSSKARVGRGRGAEPAPPLPRTAVGVRTASRSTA